MAHHLNAPQVMYPDMVLNTSQMNSERTGTPQEFQARHSSTLYNSHVHCTYCCGLLQLRGSTATPGLRAATLDAHKQVSHPFCTTCRDIQRPRVRMAIQRNLNLNAYRGTTTVSKGPPPQDFLMSYAEYLAIHHGDTYGTRAYQTSPDRSRNSRRDYWTRVIQSFYFKYHDLSKLYRGKPFHDRYEWLAHSSWQTTAGLDITTTYSGSGHNALHSPIMYTSTLASYIHGLESGQWETISIASDTISIDSTSTEHADNNDVITIDSTSTDHPDTLDQVVGLLSEIAQHLNRVRQISSVLNQLRGIVDTIDQDAITQIARVLSDMSQQGIGQTNRALDGDQPRTAD
jgi:hypothetical protein